MSQKPKRPWPADKIEQRRPDELRGYDNNPKLHSERQVLLIADAIKQWGFTNALLITDDNMVIAGHARLLAAKELKLPEVPVVVARGWSDAEIRAYVLADNQLAIAGSSFDPGLLALEVEGLRLDGFDLALTGFSPEELGAMSGVPDFSVGPIDEAGDEETNAGHTCPNCGFALGRRPVGG